MSDDLTDFFKPGLERGAPKTEGKPGILYAEDFSDQRETPKPAKMAVPSFSDADVRAARAEGFAAGQEAARSDQNATHLAVRQASLQALGEEILHGKAALMALGEERAREIAEILCAMLAAALPDFCAAHGEAEIKALMGKILPGVMPAAQLKIRVHPSIKEGLKNDLAMFEILETTPAIEGDAGLAFGDVKIHWENGRAIRDTATVIAEVRATLTAFGLRGPTPEAQP